MAIEMPHLNYEPERPPPHGHDTLLMTGMAVALFAPIAMPVISWLHWFDEPFGIVRFKDVAIFAGAPAVVFGLAVAWCWLGRKAGLPWLAFLPVLAWFLLIGYLSVRLLLPYFDEPWNY